MDRFENVEHDATASSGAAPSPAARAPGYDVARALALFGMVVVNFRGIFGAYDRGAPWLLWATDRLEGKAGALFVLLAGIGISLATRSDQDPERTIVQRSALVERAAILIAVGMLLMHVWQWDILHFHGVYLLLALPLVRASSATLWTLAVGSVWVGLVLGHELPWSVRPSLTTIPGASLHLFYNGLYPVFPWISFVLVGMAIGRLDLSDRVVRRRAFIIALALAVIAEGIDSMARWDRQSHVLGLGAHAGALLTWPRAPRPLFVVSGAGCAVALVCACVSVTDRRAQHPWILALVATGQLAFTLYVAHVVAVLVPREHGLLRDQPIEAAVAYAVGFCAAAVPCSLWWRRRFPQGPIEGVMRQFTRRDRSGPRPSTLR